MDTIKINDIIEMQSGFMRMPNNVYGLLRYKEIGLKVTDVMLYTVLLNRLNLSMDNVEKFSNEDGEVYVVYAQKDLQEETGLSKGTVIASLKRLEDNKLIKVIRQGVQKPNIYTFYNVFNLTTDSLKSKICTSRGIKIELQEVQKMDSINTNTSNTNINNNIKRYTVLENGGFLTQQYAKVYQRFKNRKHPDMTAEDLEEVELNLSEFVQENSVDEFELLQAIELYFETLPTKNNGHIKAFAMKDLNGPLNRLIT